MSELLVRTAAAEKVRAKYLGRAVDFRRSDCVRMARTLMVAMGHRPPPMPRYANEAGALRALRGMGFETLEALFDSLLPRIAPAEMRPGDLALMQSEGALGAMVASVGGDKAMGWNHDGTDFVIHVPHRIEAAWRVAPLKAYRPRCGEGLR